MTREAVTKAAGLSTMVFCMSNFGLHIEPIVESIYSFLIFEKTFYTFDNYFSDGVLNSLL